MTTIQEGLTAILNPSYFAADEKAKERLWLKEIKPHVKRSNDLALKVLWDAARLEVEPCCFSGLARSNCIRSSSFIIKIQLKQILSTGYFTAWDFKFLKLLENRLLQLNDPELTDKWLDAKFKLIELRLSEELEGVKKSEEVKRE